MLLSDSDTSWQGLGTSERKEIHLGLPVLLCRFIPETWRKCRTVALELEWEHMEVQLLKADIGVRYKGNQRRGG